jgi:hypothetical protein
MRFSKEELETDYPNTTHRNLKSNLLGKIISVKNPLLFSALIKKGAFLNELSPLTNFLIENSKDKNPEFYQLIYDLFSIKEENYSLVEKNLNKKYIQDKYSLEKILKYTMNLETNDKQDLLNKILKSYLKTNKDLFIDFIFNNISSSNKEFFNYLFIKMNEYKIDINENSPLNSFLPDENCSYSKPSSFFISSTYHEKILNLIDFGFKFNQKNYKFNNKSLIKNLIDCDLKESNENLADLDSYIKNHEKFNDLNSAFPILKELTQKIIKIRKDSLDEKIKIKSVDFHKRAKL